jgi:hypothetical protein
MKSTRKNWKSDANAIDEDSEPKYNLELILQRNKKDELALKELDSLLADPITEERIDDSKEQNQKQKPSKRSLEFQRQIDALTNLKFALANRTEELLKGASGSRNEIGKAVEAELKIGGLVDASLGFGNKRQCDELNSILESGDLKKFIEMNMPPRPKKMTRNTIYRRPKNPISNKH